MLQLFVFPNFGPPSSTLIILNKRKGANEKQIKKSNFCLTEQSHVCCMEELLLQVIPEQKQTCSFIILAVTALREADGTVG